MEVKNKLAWDLLSMLLKAELIKLGVLNGVFNIKDIRDTFNLYSSGGKKQSAVNRPRDIDEAIEISRNTPYNKNIDDVEGPGYREYMWKLAQAKSKVWGISPEEAYDSFIHPSEFNYRRWYNLASQDELDNTLTNGDAHWMDVFGKTVGADTFSNESPYSGYVNPYNPKGITGGTWTGRLGIDEYIPSESQIDNNWPLNKAWFAIDRGNKYYQEKISKGEDTHEVPSIMTYNNGVMLPEITVTHRGNYIEYSPYANGGNLAHKKSGLEYGESLDLNYPNLLPEVEVYPKWYDLEWAKRSAAGMSAIGAGLSFVPNKYARLAGTVLLIPDLFYDTRKLLVDPNTGNTVEVGLDLLKNKLFQLKVFSGLKGDKYKVRNLPLAIPGIINDATYAITGKSVSDINKKSTGGPLYPFSFEKKSFLKTPVVRYDEGGQTYTVKKGDTFSLIALNVGVSVLDLQKLNPTITNVNRIREGLSINIPPYMFSEIFNTPQSTGLYIPQVLRTQPLQQQNTPILSVEVPTQKGLKTAGPLDLLELAVRQAYTESRLRPDIVNSKGAYGLFQIMLPALDDYNRINKTNYTLEDMKNADNNLKVRNWYMDYLSNLGFIKKGDIQSDSVGMYKVLASFNAGAGHVRDALTKAKADGKDIYDSWDWVSYLWDEPREYSDFILRGIETKGTNKKDSMYNAVSAAKPDITKKIKDSIK